MSQLFYEESEEEKTVENIDPVRRVLRFFLTKFDTSDYILQQKSKTLLLMQIFAVFLVEPFLTVYLYLRYENYTLWPIPILALFCIIIAAIILIKGHYVVSAHVSLVSNSICIWLFCFNMLYMPVSVFVKISSLIFIWIVLMMVPLLILEKKQGVILYYVGHLSLFVFFLVQLKRINGVPLSDVVEFMVYTITTVCIVFIAAYLVFHIHRNAVDKAHNAEMEVQAQNEELTAANEEFEAMNEELIASQDELIVSEKKYRMLFQGLPSGVAYCKLLYDDDEKPVDFIFLEGNKNFEEITGITWDEIGGKTVFDMNPNTGRDSHAQTMEKINKTFETGKPVRFLQRVEMLHKWFDMAVYSPRPGYFVSIFNDITDAVAAEEKIKKQNEELAASEKKYRVLYDNALVGMWAVGFSSGKITRINRTGCRILGFASEDEVIDKITLNDLFIDHDEKERVLTELESHDDIFNQEIRLKSKDGSTVWIELTGKNFPDKDIVEGVFTDITKRRAAEENVHKLTFYDPLTELPNRRMFLNSLERGILKSQRKGTHNMFAVMCLGVDRFKNINDMYGPRIGDIILKQVSLRLKKLFRDDDVVSRLDGDKFITLFSDIGSTDGVLDIVQKIADAFQEPFTVENVEINLTASSGVCVYPNDGENAEQLINNSEAALYTAKENGKNGYHIFDAELNKDLLNRLQIERELREAIIENQLETYYQPKVDYSGKLIGMEALVRWRSPSRGLVPPYEFISIAEKNGMILDIGEIILHDSCRQNKAWQDAGYPALKISVNISPLQFRQENLIDDILGILKKTGLEAQWLELEVTESEIVDDEENSIARLKKLHDLGISISIDDFGTGYSSLSKLKDYPIDILKIDKSFVDSLPDDIRSATLATTIIDMAHNLGFKVVAEGVETREQLNFLAKYNCDHYQGYFFSRPLSPEDFEKKLKGI
ncbi:MAG: EAL domain-containing protein [bacterium]|nr:EAL domain-containing protein [bacterium]